MDDLIVPKEKGKLIDEAEKEVEKIEAHYEKGLLSHDEKTSQKILIWQGVKTKLEALLKTTLPEDGTVLSIINSGAKGTWAQPVQMAGMKGLVNNPSGDIIELPIKSSFSEGFNVLEYFISTHGARKGTADTALRTASAGYLTRRLVDVAHDMIVSEEDCKDKKGIVVLKKEAEDIEQNFTFKLVGRFCLEDIVSKIKPNAVIVKKGELINWQQAGEIIKEEIDKVIVRSPLSCKSIRGVCQNCYGWDLGRNRLVKIEEIFESRAPKGEAVMSLTEGKVIKIDEEKRVITIQPSKEASDKKEKKSSIKESGANKKPLPMDYKIPNRVAILVASGDEVKENQPLCAGNLDLKKLYKSGGLEETQRYILKEVQRIYSSQGVDIHDKHIEIIIQKMFSRIRIKEGGDSYFNFFNSIFPHILSFICQQYKCHLIHPTTDCVYS